LRPLITQSHQTDHRVISLQFTDPVLRSTPTPPDMTSLHQCLNHQHVYDAREIAVEKLQSRWSSSPRVIVDTPPSQPLSRQQTSGNPSTGSVKESHNTDPCTGNDRRQSPFGRLQRNNSKWTSSYGVIADSPPLQPCSHRGSAAARRRQLSARDFGVSSRV
jgi:hypothetical protein